MTGNYSTAVSSVKSALDAAYQAKLVSGTNIKTVNVTNLKVKPLPSS